MDPSDSRGQGKVCSLWNAVEGLVSATAHLGSCVKHSSVVFGTCSVCPFRCLAFSEVSQVDSLCWSLFVITI